MIVDCSTETSAAIHWSQNTVNMPCFAECRWGGRQRTCEQEPGSTVTVQILKSLRLPVDSTHSPFGQALRGGVFGSQRSDTSLRASDLLITNVCLQGRVDSLCGQHSKTWHNVDCSGLIDLVRYRESFSWYAVTFCSQWMWSLFSGGMNLITIRD